MEKIVNIQNVNQFIIYDKLEIWERGTKNILPKRKVTKGRFFIIFTVSAFNKFYEVCKH